LVAADSPRSLIVRETLDDPNKKDGKETITYTLKVKRVG
jgi:hypothetical protein